MRRASMLFVSVLLFAAAACAEIKSQTALQDAAQDATHPAASDTAEVMRAGPETGSGTASPPMMDVRPIDPQVTYLVYAHTADKLYTINPQTLAINLVGPFMIQRPGSTAMTPLTDVGDLAIDGNGGIIAITYSESVRVDPRTAVCTRLAALGARAFNGLSWVNDGTGEVLLATTRDGTVWRIDPMTGASTSVGALGGGLTSSGDLVSIAKYGTLVTVKRTGTREDLLARMDPTTGRATVIGSTGFNDVWGIGFWRDRVYGFTEAGQFILINPDTGMGTLVERVPDLHWWGAGVTTSVFVIP